MEDSAADDIRTRILDAARRCHERRGLMKMGMGEIARETGVARSTLYRYFTNRDELLLALLRQEIDATALALTRKLKGIDSPAEYIVEGLIMALQELPRQRLFVELFVSDRFALPRAEVWKSDTMVGLGHEFMRASLEPAKARGLVREEVRPKILIEWVYRILFSFLMLPSTWAKDEEELRRVLHSLLIPVLLKVDQVEALEISSGRAL